MLDGTCRYGDQCVFAHGEPARCDMAAAGYSQGVLCSLSERCTLSAVYTLSA